ncbi:MAG: HYR domain-containing protein [Thermoproteota archaeon]
MAATNYPFVSVIGSQGLVKSGVFSFPQYVAVDEAGNIYVTDHGNFRVQKFDNDGVYLHSWGSKGTDSKSFQSPAGIAVKNNFVYVVDHELNMVKKFDTTGNFISSWGSTGTDPGKFKLPNGVAVSKDNFVYVVDTGNSRVQKFDSEGKHIKTIGSSGTEQGKFLNPLGIAVDNDGNIYVGDAGNKRVQKFTAEGAFVKSYTASSGGIQISPDGVAVDSSGNIMIADAGNNRVVVLNKEGSVLTTFGTTGTSNGQFKISKDVAVDSDGDLFVVDSSNHRIQKFGSKDTVETTQTQTETQITRPLTNDFEKPDITPPKDLYIEATGGLTKVSIGMAIANDESGIKSLTSNAPTEFPLGITTVIWTAIDNAGNVGIATQTITVGDSTPPVFSNLSDIVVEAKGAQNEIDLGTPVVTDLVGVLSLTNDAPATFPLGETIVTWTATDVAKNTATAIQKVTVTDTKAPKINAPSNISVEASSLDGNQVNLGEPTVSDNNEIASISNDAPATFPLGETIVTWSAVDVSGNISTDTQKVHIVDTTKPVITQPQEVIVEAVSATANPVTLDAPDVLDVQAVTITNDAPSFFPLGSTQVTWLAVDGSGNNATVTQSVTVVDTMPPNLTVPADITQEATGQTGNIVALGEPTVDDITGISSISNNAPSDYPFGTTIITWTATDNYGNSISKNQTVTIIDTTKPEITPPKDVVAEASSITENVVTLGEPKVSDLVEIDSITHDAPSAFPLGQTTVTWTVTDSSGNTATATQLVSIIDTTAPTITVPPNIVVEATGGSGTSIPVGDAVATDAIGVGSITNDSPGIFNLGTTLVTWSATDTSGNVATATQNVTVVDTTAPTITAPADITIEATSADNNSVSLSLPTVSDIVSDVLIANDAPDTFALGETTVTWTATDEAGNSATATQKITVVDTTAPTITAPADITAEATSKSDNTVALETPSVSDNVGVASITNDAPEKFPVGETVVTWTVTDVSGLSTQTQQKIVITDTTKPEIHVSDVSIEATSEDKNSVDLGSVDATDLVEIASITNDAPDTFALGETTVTWTATDSSGNNSTATQKITVVDTTAPTITAPADITIEATSADSNQVELGDAAASDVVSLLAVANDAPAVFPLGETTVTWTATDSSGNNSTATQKITVVDTTAPTITAPADITIEATSADSNQVELGDAAASDVVSLLAVANDAPAVFPLGETTVTWTATDEAGNSATATQKITVVDTTAPTITAPADITAEATSKSDNTVALETPSVSDNVGVASITNDAPEKFPVGETIVTWTAADQAGNLQTVSQKIVIVDTVPPSFVKLDQVIVEATGVENNQITLELPQVSDILDITSITNDAPDTFALGETTVTWTATDEAGNSATATQVVTVIDTTAPKITVPQNIIIDAIALETPVSVGTATAFDLTDSSPQITNDAPSIFPLGETIVTWTAVDKYGNLINQTQLVTVQACGKPHTSYNQILGSEDDDMLLGTTLADLVFGFGGDDIIIGDKGNDCIFAGEGDDIVYGNEGDDTIIGDNGADIIKGQSGQDILNGLTGTDIIDGGDDNDSCTVSEKDGDIVAKCES